MISDYLEYYFKKYKQPFRVQTFRQKPKKWINYKGIDNEDEDWMYYINANQEPNHREVLPAEIVLDIDYHSKDDDKTKEKKALKITRDAIQKKLQELEYTYSLWHSGGSGFHFHLFFDELLKYNSFDRREMKHLITKSIGYGFLTTHPDRAKVDSPHMIQVECRMSRKNKKKILIEEVEKGENKIPKELMIKYEVSKSLESKVPVISIPLVNGEPNSIKFFLSERFIDKDGKKRALFILASWYKEQGYNADLTYQKLYEWNSYTLRGYLNNISIRAVVNSVYKNNRKVSSRYRDKLLEEIGASEFKDSA